MDQCEMGVDTVSYRGAVANIGCHKLTVALLAMALLRNEVREAWSQRLPLSLLLQKPSCAPALLPGTYISYKKKT